MIIFRQSPIMIENFTLLYNQQVIADILEIEMKSNKRQ